MSRKPTAHAVPLADHRTAIREYSAAASRLDTQTWLRPLGPSRWSPALITEHVTLAIGAFTDDAAGRAHMAEIFGPWKRFVARTLFLRRLLRTGEFPRGAVAPRETRPSSSPRQQAEALAALDRAVSDLEITIAAHPDAARCQITHPYFGRLPLPISLHLLELHARHHLGQLPRRVVPRSPDSATGTGR
jgi:hypothetical protein